LVLSGGGARGFAHIGVLQALQEQGYSVDMVSGTSIGAIIAAGCASDWSIEEIRRRIFDAFVVGSPFTDYTIPIVALLRGRKIDACLAELFGDISIEDLWLPFFCVSSNLTTGRTKLHTSGPLWRALRASVAVPGLLPPVIDPEGVLVDGAVTNNLPADAMADLQRGSVVAVDVARDAALVTPTESRLTAVMRRVLAVPPDMPTIVNVLFRAATMPGEAQTMLARSRADAILRPPLAAVDLRAWHQFDAIAQIGYDYTTGAVREGALAGIAV
jgi:NTE family protein